MFHHTCMVIGDCRRASAATQPKRLLYSEPPYVSTLSHFHSLFPSFRMESFNPRFGLDKKSSYILNHDLTLELHCSNPLKLLSFSENFS